MIRLLDDDVINRIAAGEVVERPASVLKELVENALDAGARHLAVALRGGGAELIQVTDDGSGMNRADATLCLERHATSKIQRFEDLDGVQTLGFRGEAIPSIASVSRFELLTRARGADEGTRVRMDGGRLVEVATAGAPVGTRISVRDLFFNVPARRKFMRSAPTEINHCEEALRRILLIRPDVSGELLVDGRLRISAPVAADRLERAAALLGAPGGALRAWREQRGPYEIDALLSPIDFSVPANQAQLYLYVNGRYVRDGILRKAVTEAYQAALPRGRAPLVVLELRMPTDELDVNVHPAKTEVRFRDARHVIERVGGSVQAGLSHSGVRIGLPAPGAGWAVRADPGDQLGLHFSATGQAGAETETSAQQSTSAAQLVEDRPHLIQGVGMLAESNPQPSHTERSVGLSPYRWDATVHGTSDMAQHISSAAEAEIGGPQPSQIQSQRTQSDPQHSARGGADGLRRSPPAVDPQPAWRRSWTQAARPAPLLAAVSPAPAPAPSGSARYQDLRLIGQALGRFVVAEGPDGLVLVDQHALALALVRAQLDALDDPPGRTLLSPRVIALSADARARLARLQPVLDTLGVVAEAFGGDAVILKQLPLALSGADADALLPALLASPTIPGEAEGTPSRRGVADRLATLAVPLEQQRSVYELRELLKRADAVLGVSPADDTRRCRVLSADDLLRILRGGQS